MQPWGTFMSVRTRRGLLIFIGGFGTYAILLPGLGPLPALLAGIPVAALAVSVDRWLRARRDRRIPGIR